MVNAMRRSWITGARPNSEARRRAIGRAAGDGVVDASRPVCSCDLGRTRAASGRA